MKIDDLYTSLGLDKSLLQGGQLDVQSPIDGSTLAQVQTIDAEDVKDRVSRAVQCFRSWRTVPAPKRGELIRLFGGELRRIKEPLGELVAVENGKIRSEGLGEVQEMIDICDFAVGLSRQLYGITMASERPGHKMMETWHPLGPIGVISAFNFPVAVWAWNFAIAIVCGDPVLWKPSSKTPITALACQSAFERTLHNFDKKYADLSQVLIGNALGQELIEDERVPLISATGSCRMGRLIAPRIAQRMGRCILELGGNNAMIVAPSADLVLAVRAILFSAVGTAGQRCTSLRRLIVQEDIHDSLMNKLQKAYASIPVGSPLEDDKLVGPLIDKKAFDEMQKALGQARTEGGNVFGGERVLQDIYPDAFYVRPAIVQMPAQTAIVQEETFAPILYVMKYRTLFNAIELNNGVKQGLSSCVFTTDIREAEQFLSAEGSDCGIANVNIGPSGAEIGGAFGGEKNTGGGREAGSDSWKAYMRRATNTINYSHDLPLAQGIKFDV